MRRTTDDWTPVELEILREFYVSSTSAEILTLLPGRTVYGLHQKAHHEGLRKYKPLASCGRAWSPEEDALLRQLYPDNSVESLLKHLPARSRKAIERRAFNLGLVHSQKFWDHHYANKIGLRCYPPEVREVIRLGRKLKKAINDREAQHR